MVQSKELWTCPECGHQFITANMWHSCGNFKLEDHFSDKEPIVREIFDSLVALVNEFGPVTVYAQKTRIVFQVRTRFVAIMTRKRWLILQIWLKRRADHPLLQRIEYYTYRDFGHIFRIRGPEEIDEALQNLLHEAYALES